MSNIDACPVDHKTRDAWLEKSRAKAKAEADALAAAHPAPSPPTKSWSQTLSSYFWSSDTSAATAPNSNSGLDTNRVISTIPRTASSNPIEHGYSANAEIDTGSDAGTGNWVYPSEKMFFDAMKRKGYEAHEVDMKTVVPIHNAVNEKAWEQIKAWEAPYLKGSTCEGPKLESFANKMDRMTPTARINTLLGYTSPFDRHDWVIDRCGTRVDYVIDFYSGRSDGKSAPSFYLDVRPKLNTWEGVKMRAMRWTGMA